MNNARDKVINELLPRVRAQVQKSVKVGNASEQLAEDMQSEAAVALVALVTAAEAAGKLDADDIVRQAHLAAVRFYDRECAQQGQLADDVTDEVIHEVPTEASSPLDMLQRAELELALDAASDVLTEKQGDVMRLRYEEGLTQEQTAEQLKIDRTAVAKLERRALDRMRANIEARGFDKGDFLTATSTPVGRTRAPSGTAVRRPGKRCNENFVRERTTLDIIALRRWLNTVWESLQPKSNPF